MATQLAYLRSNRPWVWAIAFLLAAMPLKGQELDKADMAIRFATFNTAFSKDQPAAMLDALRAGDDVAMKQVAEIIQIVRPDVLLLNEFDFDSEGQSLQFLLENYLGQSQNGRPAIRYDYWYCRPSNTGELSKVDLNNDGNVSLPDDAFGFGRHPGHYGMLVLSKLPIDAEACRTFQRFLWKDMPGALWPVDPRTDQAYYSDEARQVFRLSSKSHWDVVVRYEDQPIHFLVCHPTPPVFDGAEDRNGARNHDEIRFWADYVGGKGDYIRDDEGRVGGLADEALFVVAGDLNADPYDGDSREKAVLQLTEHPRIADPHPKSLGGQEQSERQGGANQSHRGDPAEDTGDFGDRSPGNLRIDFVLPCRQLKTLNAGVFWPTEDQPEFALVSASDHRLVWVDVAVDRSK